MKNDLIVLLVLICVAFLLGILAFAFAITAMVEEDEPCTVQLETGTGEVQVYEGATVTIGTFVPKLLIVDGATGAPANGTFQNAVDHDPGAASNGFDPTTSAGVTVAARAGQWYQMGGMCHIEAYIRLNVTPATTGPAWAGHADEEIRLVYESGTQWPVPAESWVGQYATPKAVESVLLKTQFLDQNGIGMTMYSAGNSPAQPDAMILGAGTNTDGDICLVGNSGGTWTPNLIASTFDNMWNMARVAPGEAATVIEIRVIGKYRTA